MSALTDLRERRAEVRALGDAAIATARRIQSMLEARQNPTDEGGVDSKISPPSSDRSSG